MFIRKTTLLLGILAFISSCQKDFFQETFPIINSLDWNYEKNNGEIYKISELQELLKDPQRNWLIRKDIKPPRIFKIFSIKFIFFNGLISWFWTSTSSKLAMKLSFLFKIS